MITYRCLKHLTKGHVGASQLQHIVLKNEVVSPHVFDIGFECRSKRTVIVKTSHTTIDLEGLRVEELSFEKVLTILTVVLLGQVNWLAFLSSYWFLYSKR